MMQKTLQLDTVVLTGNKFSTNDANVRFPNLVGVLECSPGKQVCTSLRVINKVDAVPTITFGMLFANNMLRQKSE